MKKLLLRRVLNLLLWLSVCFLAATGFVIHWKLPHGLHGVRGGGGSTLLGLSRHDWGEWHFWVGVGFIVLVLAHLVMAWPWLRNAAAGRKRLWAVVAGLVLGLAIPATLLLYPVEIGSGGSGDGASVQSGTGVSGGQGNGYRGGRSDGE